MTQEYATVIAVRTVFNWFKNIDERKRKSIEREKFYDIIDDCGDGWKVHIHIWTKRGAYEVLSSEVYRGEEVIEVNRLEADEALFKAINGESIEENKKEKIKKMEIEGKIIYVSTKEQRRSGEGKNGKWATDFFVVETNEQYPSKVAMEVFSNEGNPRWKEWSSVLVTGNSVKASFDIDAREWQGKWFNSIKCYKLELVAKPAAVVAPAGIVNGDNKAFHEEQVKQTQIPQPTFWKDQQASNSGDDLPF